MYFIDILLILEIHQREKVLKILMAIKVIAYPVENWQGMCHREILLMVYCAITWYKFDVSIFFEANTNNVMSSG